MATLPTPAANTGLPKESAATRAPGSLPDLVATELRAQIADKTLELPLLPSAAVQIAEAASSDQVDARALADILRKDQAVAAHLLRLVNSPLYAARSAIVSLQQAAARLGAARIRELALAIACRVGVFQVPGFDTEVKAQFQHSMAAALFAQEIARATRNNVEDAFLAGLLHDVGRPVLLQAAIKLCAKHAVAVEHGELLALVSELHATAGAALIEAWQLPSQLAIAVLHHHDADPPPRHAAALRGLQLADDLAHHTLDPARVERQAIEAHPALAVLEIYPETLERLLSRVENVRLATQTLP